MENKDIDIPLDEKEKAEKIEFLKKRKFRDFAIHPYYNRNSYAKHGIELEAIEQIYPQFDKIIKVLKRPAQRGFKYSFVYKLGEMNYFYLCFYLDEEPPKFFNAFPEHTNAERKLKKKIEKWMKKEIFNKQE